MCCFLEALKRCYALCWGSDRDLISVFRRESCYLIWPSMHVSPSTCPGKLVLRLRWRRGLKMGLRLMVVLNFCLHERRVDIRSSSFVCKYINMNAILFSYIIFLINLLHSPPSQALYSYNGYAIAR